MASEVELEDWFVSCANAGNRRKLACVLEKDWRFRIVLFLNVIVCVLKADFNRIGNVVNAVRCVVSKIEKTRRLSKF
jgi:hypothetical protein